VKKLRVSFIEFLNALPLGWGFLHGKHKGAFDVLFDVPSECSKNLSNGEADVGLIPVIEYQRIEGLKVIPEISISTKREARSVLFLSRVPFDEVESVSLDSSSRTSVALLKILMGEFHSRRSVKYVESVPAIDCMLNECDAALLIGNPALQVSSDKTPYVYDLAEEWFKNTGLPFVFAFWAVSETGQNSSDFKVFRESKEEGLSSLKQIAKLYSPQLQIPETEIISYLSENLNYSLDEINIKGLELFFELAQKYSLIPGYRPLDFVSLY
jgi:chorismate dehydratase